MPGEARPVLVEAGQFFGRNETLHRKRHIICARRMPLREYEAVLRPHRHEMRDHQGIDARQVSPEMPDTGTIVHLDQQPSGLEEE